MCWETLPESRKSNSVLSHSAKSQERAWTVMQWTLCCYPSSQPCGRGPYRLQHHLQFTRALPVLQHQLFPCPNAHFVGTTPLFIFQLPIIWTSYYLVNNSTSLTSFIINFFFLNQKLRVTYLSASYTQVWLNTGFFWVYYSSLPLRFWSFLARYYPKPHCLNPGFAKPFPACPLSLRITACLTDTSQGAAKQAAEFHSRRVLLSPLLSAVNVSNWSVLMDQKCLIDSVSFPCKTQGECYMEEPGLCTEASLRNMRREAIKKYEFIKGSSELAGGRESSPAPRGRFVTNTGVLFSFQWKTKQLLKEIRSPNQEWGIPPETNHSSPFPTLQCADSNRYAEWMQAGNESSHCVTQISLLTAKPGWKSPTLFFFFFENRH